jgi:diguanylate cyclase (GGDEF)-like protein
VPLPPAWSTQQLAEFLAAVSVAESYPSAARVAVERAAEAFEAEMAAIVRGDAVEASVGFPQGTAPVAEIAAVATGGADSLLLPGVGECRATAAALDDGAAAWLVVGRVDDDCFTSEEKVLLRSMARVLGLTERSLRVLEDERALREESERQAAEKADLLETLRKRQTLLERLSDIQRSIVRRAGRDEVLDAVVEGLSELTGHDVAFLRLVDPDDTSSTEMVASRGIDPELLDSIRRAPVGMGASGTSIQEDRTVTFEDYRGDERSNPASARHGVRGAMAAPVHRQGVVVGSLVIGSYDAAPRFSDEQREVLEAFAENASIALTDAAMVDAAFHQAFHDSLTGLANRAAFLDRLAHAQAVAERSGTAVGVLFLDVDRFKTVNDSLGHAAGDELLMGVAARLSICLRDGDTPARFGGDEFAVLLEGVSGQEEGEAVAARVLEAMREPFRVQGRQMTVSVSVGVALATSRGEDVLRNADLAMYRAKSDGRDRHATYEPEMHAALVEGLELQADLRRAVDRGEFVVHYQPIVDLATGGILGAEALVRWEHPERGLIPPGAFIPLAEETHLIVPIGRHVLRKACEQAARWVERHGDLTMSVNLSATQLDHPDLVADVAAALRDGGLDPARLTLEITESVLMANEGVTVERLHELKALGVQLAVDDFGTGYSSLTYLRDFPLDVLKVAKPFVDGLGGADQGVALARAIIELGEACQLDVVGEGIELSTQRQGLLELGCKLGQGFLFARPADAAAIDALLAEHDGGSDAAAPADFAEWSATQT